MAKMNALFFFQMYRISMGYLISISVLGFLFNMAIIILFLAVKKVRQTSHVFTLIDLYFRKYQLFFNMTRFHISTFSEAKLDLCNPQESDTWGQVSQHVWCAEAAQCQRPRATVRLQKRLQGRRCCQQFYLQLKVYNVFHKVHFIIQG